MYSTTALMAAALVGQGRVSISSPLSEAKNDSERALSQHWPVRPCVVLGPRRRRRYRSPELRWIYLADVDGSGVEVDVAPAQAEDFAAPQAADERQVHGQREGLADLASVAAGLVASQPWCK
jgi:hypothetical protein